MYSMHCKPIKDNNRTSIALFYRKYMADLDPHTFNDSSAGWRSLTSSSFEMKVVHGSMIENRWLQ